MASRVIHLSNGLETWDMKVTSHLNGTMAINDNEWGSLVQLMEDWLVGIDEAVEYVGTTVKEEDRDKNNMARYQVKCWLFLSNFIHFALLVFL